MRANEWTEGWQPLHGFRLRTVTGKMDRVREVRFPGNPLPREEGKVEGQVDWLWLSSPSLLNEVSVTPQHLRQEWHFQRGVGGTLNPTLKGLVSFVISLYV